MVFTNYEKYKALVDEALEHVFDGLVAPTELIDGMKYALLGGKRLRPCLMLATVDMLGGDTRQALTFACALEILHTGSLIHDDLPCLDNDSLRRGRASNHANFGYAQALLQGDAMINIAHSSLIENLWDENSARAAHYISDEAGARGMLGGQYLDILAQGKEYSEQKILQLCDLKTSSMFRAAIVGAAFFSGEVEFEDWRKWSTNLGLAFQIADDLIDAGYGVAVAGKTLGKDAKSLKSTFVTSYGVSKAYETLLETLKQSKTYPKHLREFAEYIVSSIKILE